MGSYLRVRVCVNLTQALARGRTLKVKGESIWIPFSYEKMPCICFSCGCIVHGINGCCSVMEDLESKEEQYGAWLRATQFQRSKNFSNFSRREDGLNKWRKEETRPFHGEKSRDKKEEEEEARGGDEAKGEK